MSKIEIRQCDGEKGIFTEILIDGHKLTGVRRFELKQDAGGVPVLSLDLNAFDLATDLQILKINLASVGDIESIKFVGDDTPWEFKNQEDSH